MFVIRAEYQHFEHTEDREYQISAEDRARTLWRDEAPISVRVLDRDGATVWERRE